MGNDSGGRVRTLRTANGISQADLAASVGVSKSYLSHIEAGRRPISAALAQRLAQTLGIDVEQLTTGTPADAHEDLRLKLAFAELSLRNGDRELASREFAAALERARKLPMNRFVDEATWGLARSQEATGAARATRSCSYEALLARPELSPAVPRVRVSIDLILAYCECGDVARAVDIGEQALAALADLEPPPDVSLRVELIGTLAGCYLERGDLTRAQLLTDRALRLSNQDGAPRARAAAAWNAAVIANGRHDSIGAREHADRALALYSEIDNARNVALLRVVSAALRLRQPEPDGHAALRDLERAMGDLHEAGSRVDFGYAHTLQAKAYLVIGDLARAEEAGRRALDDLSAGDRLQTGWAMLGLGRVAAARGDSTGPSSCSPGRRPRWRRPVPPPVKPVRRGVSSARPTWSWGARRRASRRCAGPATSPARRTTRSAVRLWRRRRSPPAADPAKFGRVARLAPAKGCRVNALTGG